MFLSMNTPFFTSLFLPLFLLFFFLTAPLGLLCLSCPRLAALWPLLSSRALENRAAEASWADLPKLN